jgi:D-3-phosphoglycerate dehydrogenase
MTRSVLITTSPFGEGDPQALRLLEEEGIAYTLNPYGRRLREQELAQIIGPYEVWIAGTDPITEAVLDRAPELRLIAHTGIGLDNIPLAAVRARGIAVTYTPSAPSPAVAEFVIGQMLALLRKTVQADRGMRHGLWQRRIGRRLSGSTVGVIGAGRVGSLVIRHLQAFQPLHILANDLVRDDEFARSHQFTWTDKETVFREADIITLHVPLTRLTTGLIGVKELAIMKPDAILINTSRGGIVDEVALVAMLRSRPAFSAAVDVFEEEPYAGELASLENCLLSCHMGSCTFDCRLEMELQAVREVIRYFRSEPFSCPVPEEEYRIQDEK